MKLHELGIKHIIFFIFFSVLSFSFEITTSFAMEERESKEVGSQIRKGFFPNKHTLLTEEKKITNKNNLKFDEERSLYYFGEKLSNLPQPTKKVEPIAEDGRKVVFSLTTKSEDEPIENANKKHKSDEKKDKDSIEDTIQRLLLAKSSTNDILEDIDLLKKYEGLLTSDKDRRTEIPNPFDFPWNANGSLIMTFNNNSQYIGTGTLIGKRAVLTAGHNLYDRKMKREVESVIFYPGRDKLSIYGEGKGVRMVIHPEWKKENSTNPEKSDIGLVILEEDFEKKYFKNNEEKLCFFGYNVIKMEDLVPQNNLPDQHPRFINIAGYPGAGIIENRIRILNGEQMLSMKGKVNSIKNGRIYYDIDTSPGNSGSGVWFYNENVYTCCAIHTNGGDKLEGNGGVFLDEDKCSTIDYWLVSELPNDYNS